MTSSKTSTPLICAGVTLTITAIALVIPTMANSQEPEASEAIEEIIITGYMPQRKEHVVGSVAGVDINEAMKNITHDPALSLQGRAAGVQVLTDGGIAGAEAKVIIRGTATFGNTDPLFVIDGAFSANGMKGLNSSDIESINILKDAAAASIYGSRAANGVVEVTTRKGTKGPPQIELSSNFGYQTPSETLKYSNADQWRNFSNQVSANDGNPLVPEDGSPNFSQGVDENWQDRWFDDAPMSSHNISVSGGGDNSTYHVSFGHLKQEGLIKFSEFDKSTARINLGLERGKFKFTQNLGFAQTNNRPNTSYTSTGLDRLIVLLPTVPLTDAQGNFIVAGEDFYQEGNNATSGVGNAYALASTDERKIENLDIVGSFSASYEFFDGLRYQLTVSGNYNDNHDFDRNQPYSFPIVGGSGGAIENLNPSINEVKGTRSDYTIDNLLFYDIDFGEHSFSTVVGYSEFNEDFRETGTSVIFDNVFESQLTTITGDATSSGLELKSQLNSYFARVNYFYGNKYQASVSVRRDKSSKFASGNNEDTFPSFSAGWNVHEESFFPTDSVISRLKVTASYGELGANFIDPYQFSSVAFGPLPAIFGDNQNGPADRSFGRVTQLLDPNLTWETSTSSNIGVEMGFWDDALTISAEYFDRENEDILAPVPLPPSAGQQILINTGRAPDVNAATVNNTGFELDATYSNYDNAFGYDVTLQLSTIDNEVVSLGENVVPINGFLLSGSFDDRPTRTDTGHPIGSFYGYRTQGLDGNGNFIFEDTNGRDASGNLTGQPDGQINDDDKVILGDPHPDFTYGINFSGVYKDWDFSVFLEGSQGNDIFSQIKYQNYFLFNGNVVTGALDAWTPSNTSATIPIATINNRGGGNALPSDFYVEDGSYWRIKNIQVGYTFSESTLEKFHLGELRMYLGAQNLYTSTDYSGYDPQVSSDSLFNRGIDYRGYPNAKTYTFGLNVSF